jgi:excisionase family DNA binding protein
MELMTIQEAADALRVAPVTVRRYIAKGRLRAVRVGRGLRVEKETVESLPEPVLGNDEYADIPERGRKYLKYLKPIPEGDYAGLSGLIGLFDGADDGATDVSTNKHKYLAEAYEAHLRNAKK